MRTTRPRAPASEADRAAFEEHLRATFAFTDALRESRCRKTDHFREGLSETLDAFAPIFSPRNAQILFKLYMEGPRRFNDLKRSLGDISSRVLTDKLRDLEAQGFVVRETTAEASTYQLTPRGDEVARLLHPLVFLLHS